MSISDRPSHSETYRAGVVERVGPMRTGAFQSWIVRVTDADGRSVRGASIDVSAWMPDAGEPPSVRPRSSSELGGGLYRIEGLRFTEPGWWNVPLQITSAAGIDSLAFNLVLPARP
jgi:hypothetical protein